MAAAVEWRAGKLNWDGKRVTADARKGLIRLSESDDGLMHVHWVDRKTKQVEEDLIVMADAYLEHIPQCTTGRAYVMRYTSSDRKFLIWQQEPDATKDAELVQKFNSTIGAEIPAPKAAGTAPAASAPAAAVPGA